MKNIGENVASDIISNLLISGTLPGIAPKAFDVCHFSSFL